MGLQTKEIETLTGIKLVQQREYYNNGCSVSYGRWEYLVNGRRVHHWTYERIEDETHKGFYTEKYSIQDEVTEIFL